MGASHRWITDAVHPFEYDVASCVPPVFEAYARVFHPAYRTDLAVAWKAVAQANNRISHPAMEWGSLVGSWHLKSQPGLWDRPPDIGELPVPTTDALRRILRQFLQGAGVAYALWNGYAGMAIANASLINLPNRPMYVIDGSIDDATEPFGIPGRTANLWWAGERQWCVATDIDLMTTYVGGSAPCIQSILRSAALEALPVSSDQGITWETDTINPLPDPPYRL